MIPDYSAIGSKLKPVEAVGGRQTSSGKYTSGACAVYAKSLIFDFETSIYKRGSDAMHRPNWGVFAGLVEVVWHIAEVDPGDVWRHPYSDSMRLDIAYSARKTYRYFACISTEIE